MYLPLYPAPRAMYLPEARYTCPIVGRADIRIKLRADTWHEGRMRGRYKKCHVKIIYTIITFIRETTRIHLKLFLFMSLGVNNLWLRMVQKWFWLWIFEQQLLNMSELFCKNWGICCSTTDPLLSLVTKGIKWKWLDFEILCLVR